MALQHGSLSQNEAAYQPKQVKLPSRLINAVSTYGIDEMQFSNYLALEAGVDCPSTFSAPPVPRPVLLPDDCAL